MGSNGPARTIEHRPTRFDIHPKDGVVEFERFEMLDACVVLLVLRNFNNVRPVSNLLVQRVRLQGEDKEWLRLW